MRKQIRILFLFYFFITVLDLVLIYFNLAQLRWFTKPLLIPLLLFAVIIKRSEIKLFKLIFIALFLSWVGDVLLQMKGLFIPGLVSFLLAHVFYIVYFLKIQPQKKGLLQWQPFIGIPVLVYIVIFLFLLYPFLDALKIPVTVYGITIGTMLLMAINTKRKLNKDASTLFFNGALQFAISDSLLAVNMFAYNSFVLSVCVMLTYASAQWLIVKGSMISDK